MRTKTCDQCVHGILIGEGDLLCDLKCIIKKDYEFIACPDFMKED